MSIRVALEKVQSAPFIVDVLRAGDELAVAAAGDGGARSVRALTRAIHDPSDELTATAAVHALARVFDDEADAELSALLSHHRAFLREHAAWALSGRLPRLDAVGRLVAVVISGGFSGTLAQRTLELWAGSAADHIALALEGALAGPHDTATRARLVETLGLVPGPIAARRLREAATDPLEDLAVRVTAVAAIGDRPADGSEDVVLTAAGGDGPLATAARLAMIDLGLTGRRSPVAPGRGLTVAQLFLHADLDAELSRVGTGDNGGIATLLVRLGAVLSEQPQIAQVRTISRGSAAAALDAFDAGRDDRHRLMPVPLLADAVSATAAWPTRVTARRGIRRVLRDGAGVDALHLRMADVGSMAAAEAAGQLGIATVFTLAPDPHAVIHALDMTDALTRVTFGSTDEREHFWFRARLVQRLAANAAHVVLFPRPELRHDLRALLGIDVDDEPERYTVVAEGIDLTVSRQAAAALAAGDDGGLGDLVATLPPHRRHLPLAISVGRLHPVKGMSTVVAAWADDPALRGRCNLVLVGGDLTDPSPEERGQLDRIAETLGGDTTGLLLGGHRPNTVVAHWLAALAGRGGVYVCGSLKEEFGLALLEALAAGLPVVAPNAGGPATYIEPGITGLLIDTRSTGDLARAMGEALDLAVAPDRAARVARARTLISERFTLQTMAATLAPIYTEVSRDPAHHQS